MISYSRARERGSGALEERTAEGHGPGLEGWLAEDEVRRTHAFLLVTGVLAVVGAATTFLFDGHARWRIGFLLGVSLLLTGYFALWWRTRALQNYRPLEAVLVVSVCNLAGVAACFYYGLFSPAPMILMLPIAFIGRSASGGGAFFAYALAASSVGIPMGLVSLGLIADPGLVRGDELNLVGRLLYTALVQAAFLTCLINARRSREATLAAFRSLLSARLEVQSRDAQLEEVNDRLDEILHTGLPGPMTGHSLGQWSLGGLLGRGAMGDVYAARRLGGTEAAVKVLNPVTAHEPQALDLIRREAALLRSIDSPHVVGFLEVSVEHGQPWIAMERLHGDMLSEILRKERRLPVAQVARMVRHVAVAMDAAARVNVLHRDLKPSNICRAIVGEGTRWKLFDFGVGKRLGEDMTYTRNKLVGTPGYIPPEAVRGDTTDARGDVFSLAAVAYRALTGERPYRGRAQRLLISTVDEQPARPSAWPGVPAALDHVLAVGLAKRPEDRFDTGGEFARAFEQAVKDELPSAIRRRAAHVLARQPWEERLPT